MSFQVCIQNTGEHLACAQGQNVLHAMEALGRKGIPVGCRGGGCGVCKVRVLEGTYRTEKMSRACVTQEEQESGMALACKLFPTGDLRVDVVGKMVRAVSRSTQAVFKWPGRFELPTGRSD